jgi:hydrogenase expression/formation protein HypD
VKFVDEYRDAVAGEPPRETSIAWPPPLGDHGGLRGQTHSIVRYGSTGSCPRTWSSCTARLPVCVTPLETIDRRHAIARRPGSCSRHSATCCACRDPETDLSAHQGGGRRRARRHLAAPGRRDRAREPQREVVFFAIGFETTAPANAMAVKEAHRRELSNFSVLTSHVLVPPSIASILQASDNPRPGLPRSRARVRHHRSPRVPIAGRQYGTPIVVTGFEPIDLLEGVKALVEELEAGRAACSQRLRPDRRGGRQRAARAVVDEVFEVVDHPWRGIGGFRNRGSASASVPRPRCRRAVRRREPPHARAHRMRQRTRAPRAAEALRLSAVRPSLHARDATRRHDGLGRRARARVLPYGRAHAEAA